MKKPLRCYFSNNPMSLKEALAVDGLMRGHDDGFHEEFLDALEYDFGKHPEATRAPPYVHEHRHGYDVLNCSRRMYNKVAKHLASKGITNDPQALENKHGIRIVERDDNQQEGA